MTISASEEAEARDALGRTLKLYRDLSVALLGQIDQLKAGAGGGDPVLVEKHLGAHRKAVQSVHDAEASLVKRSRAEAGGRGASLDLAAARAEILARLAVWVAER